MEACFVIEVIEEHFNISITSQGYIRHNHLIYLARCAAVLIMLENTHPAKIAKLLCGHRTNIYHWKDTANEKLNNCPEFKKCYLECVAAVTQKEEALLFYESSKTDIIQANTC